MKTQDKRSVRAIVRQQAEKQASYARENPDAGDIYWFPIKGDAEKENEIRIVVVAKIKVPSQHGVLSPFYFREDSVEGVKLWTAISEINKREFGKLKLPEGWGKWSDAVKME